MKFVFNIARPSVEAIRTAAKEVDPSLESQLRVRREAHGVYEIPDADIDKSDLIDELENYVGERPDEM